MIAGVVINNLQKYGDKRGWLSEVYRSDSASYSPAMGYVSVTRPNQVRGPHEHRQQADFFIFLGPGEFKVYLWDNRKNSKTHSEKMVLEAGGKNPLSLLIPPGVVHAYKCISAVDGQVINLPDKLYKGEGRKEEVDEIRHEDDKQSPFKVD